MGMKNGNLHFVERLTTYTNSDSENNVLRRIFWT